MFNFKKEVEYSLVLPKQLDEEIKKTYYFFNTDFEGFFNQAIMFFKVYRDFKKKNPDGKILFVTKETKQEILLFKDKKDA